MARFAAVLSLAVAAIIAIQTTKVFGVAIGGSCGINDTCDPCPPQSGPVCCDGLRYTVAGDGSIFDTTSSGTCTCCDVEGTDNVCGTDNASFATNGDIVPTVVTLTSCRSQNP